MRYHQTADNILFEAPVASDWKISSAELRGLLISTAGFIVFVAIFAFVAFGDSLVAP
jgi:hypothetical protein